MVSVTVCTQAPLLPRRSSRRAVLGEWKQPQHCQHGCKHPCLDSEIPCFVSVGYTCTRLHTPIPIQLCFNPCTFSPGPRPEIGVAMKEVHIHLSQVRQQRAQGRISWTFKVLWVDRFSEWNDGSFVHISRERFSHVVRCIIEGGGGVGREGQRGRSHQS